MASKEETTAAEEPASTSEAKAPSAVAEDAPAEVSKESPPSPPAAAAAPATTTEAKKPEETPPDNTDKSCRVYVGNLAWEVTWQDLKDHMKSTGLEVVRATVLTTAGRSKGCGLAEFATAEEAAEAVRTLTDTEMCGRQIFIREDREERSVATPKPAATGGASRSFTTGQDAKTRRVYVGNLSWDVAWQDLKDHMRQAGDVVHAEVITEYSGRSKGCGIVEFASEEAAAEAISTLTDTELKGRMIFVREDREAGQGQHAGVAGMGRPQNTSVYVWNLAPETSWQDLKDHMRKAGNVDSATILTNAQGESLACGVVVYQKPQEAARAIRELQNSELNGQALFAREDRERHPRGRGGRGPGGGGRGAGGGPGGRGSGGGRHGGRGGRGGVPPEGTQIYVGNLSPATTWRDLKDHFRQCGDVRRAEVTAGGPKGNGTVQFATKQDADAAIQRLNGSDLQGRTLEVRRHQKAR